MHEELNCFIRNDVWKLIIYLDSRNIIKTKWVFKKNQTSMEQSSETKQNCGTIIHLSHKD
jgi:hypothetical protein